MARDGAWTTEKQAAESRGSHLERVCIITLPDPDSFTPNTGWYLRPKTLYLTDAKELLRDSTVTVDSEYWPAVLEWGDVFQEGSPGDGLASISDTTLRLSNHKIAPQVKTGDIGGVTALSPEPDGVHIRLSQLFQLYGWIGAAVAIKLLWFESSQTNQGSASYPYQEATMFSGVIAGASIGRDDIALDITQDESPGESPLPRNEITNPPTQKDATFKAPVCYGNFAAQTEDLGGYERYLAAAIGLKGPLTPVVPYAVDGVDPEDYRLVWNDADGPNVGWTDQANFGSAPPSANDKLYRYNPDTDSLTIVRSTAPPTDGFITFEDDADTNGKCTIYVGKRLRGITYLTSNAIETSNNLTNPQNLIARNPAVYAELDLSTTASYIMLRIPSTQALGNIPRNVDNILFGWIAIYNTTVDAGVRVQMGLYASTVFLGTAREITGTEIGTQGIKGQTAGSVGGTITAANLLTGGAGNKTEQPPYAWQWALSDGTNTYDLFLRIAVKTAGSAGQKLRITAGGLYVSHDLQTYVSKPPFDPLAGLNVGARSGGGGGDVSRTIKPGRHINKIAQSNTTALFMDPSQSSLDDASGTISGTASLNLESPAHIVAHELVKWGDGCAAADLVLADSTFGSFRDAKTDLDKYLDDVTGGSSLAWKACLTTDGESVADEVARICAQTPMMVQRGPGGVYYASVFPRIASISAALKYKNSAGGVVAFHPNYAHPSSTSYGKPYSLVDFRADIAPLSRLYNAFRVRYRRFAPTGDCTRTVYVDSAGFSVWDATAGALDTSGDTLGEALKTICVDAEALYGKRREMLVEADTISDHATATALLSSLVRRFGWQPVLPRGLAFLESYDLQPGHIIKIDDDMNNIFPMPQYGATNWSWSSFFVSSVRHVPSPAGVMVEFSAEEIVY